MEGKTRVVTHADSLEVEILRQRVAELERKVASLINANTSYGTWGGFPPNEQYWLDKNYGLDSSEKKVVIDWENLVKKGEDNV